MIRNGLNRPEPFTPRDGSVCTRALGPGQGEPHERYPSLPKPGESAVINTYFFVNCATCGRPLRASIKLLGAHLQCQHCGGHFHATDPAADGEANTPPNLYRAGELLRGSRIAQQAAALAQRHTGFRRCP